MDKLKSEMFNHYAEKWLQKNYKEVFVGEQVNEDERDLLVILSLTMMVADEEIEEYTSDSDFNVITELLLELSNNNYDALMRIFDRRKKHMVDNFNHKLQEIEAKIMKDKLIEVNNILGTGINEESKTDIISKIREGCFKHQKNNSLVERYDRVKSELQFTNQLLEGLNFKALLGMNFDRNENWVERVAFLIYKPEIVNKESFVIYDEWDDFPLKWSLYYKSVPEGRLVFSQYLKTKDLNFYYSHYEAHTIKELEKITTNRFLHKNVQDRYPLIKEVIENYQDQRYASTVLLSLSIIEGLLWDLSKMIYKLEGKIYNDLGIMLDSVTGNVIKENKIRELLKRTEMKDYLYMPFIEYFCEELYEERNPIMHGREIKRFEKSNALQKLFALENVLKELQKYNEKQMMELFEQFDDRAKDFFRKIKE